MRLSGPLEAERRALLAVLDGAESACPDCRTRAVRVTWMADLQRWHVSVDHSRHGCTVPRRAPSRRAYERWLADQLAVLGARVAHYGSCDDVDLTHR